jgi:hypothetical protein
MDRLQAVSPKVPSLTVSEHRRPALLLAQEGGPLVIDQPEDELDSTLCSGS